MADKKPEETLTLTRGQLDEIIRSAVETSHNLGRKAAVGTTEAEAAHLTQEERVHKILGTPVPNRDPLKTYLVPCRNPRNGAKFTAVVVPSRHHEHGRVVRIEDYRYPADLLKRAPGGEAQAVLPAGSVAGRSGKVLPLVDGSTVGGANVWFSRDFMQWYWSEFFQRDSRDFVGQGAELLPKCGEAREWKPESSARTFGSMA